MRKIDNILLTAFGLLVVGLLVLGPERVDRAYNKVSDVPMGNLSPDALSLHERLIVADLHSDFLLWDRDFLDRNNYGHVDLPRLEEGNVGIQVFSAVTDSRNDTPVGDRNATGDRVGLLAAVEAWPISAWTSPFGRAKYQAQRLNHYQRRSEGRLTILLNAADLEGYLQKRGRDARVAGILALEGMHALEGDLNNINRLYTLGYRIMAPVHMFDNDVAGSQQGETRGGLTDFGRKALRRMDSLRVIIDLAHASSQTIRDVINVTRRPVIVSHTGVQGTCNNSRNLTDAQLRLVAARGGLIGIGFWDTATCGSDVAAIVKAIRHVTRVVGVDNVALGSDFDGTVKTPIDAAGMARITEALMQSGFTDREIRLIMGENVVRFLGRNLPRY